MKLQGGNALVTGGARRLGRRIALGLAEAGMNVAVGFRTSGEEARKTAREIREHNGVAALPVRADFADEHQTDEALARIREEFGRVDLLVANAGAFRRTLFRSLSEEDWDAMIRDNLDSFLVPAIRVGPLMKKQGSGTIVALADVAAFLPWKDHAPYCLAKNLVVHAVRRLAAELAPEVRVNAVAPGPVLDPESRKDPAFEREIRKTLLQRSGSASDIIDAVLFLARSEFVTGIVLPVDGGRLVHK